MLFYTKNYLKLFPAFRTRFFYFSKEKNKKELKQLLQSGLGIFANFDNFRN